MKRLLIQIRNNALICGIQSCLCHAQPRHIGFFESGCITGPSRPDQEGAETASTRASPK